MTKAKTLTDQDEPTEPEATTPRDRAPQDPELKAIRNICNQLNTLDAEACARVLNYVLDRFVPKVPKRAASWHTHMDPRMDTGQAAVDDRDEAEGMGAEPPRMTGADRGVTS